ncbi:hypothetical protein HMPREF1548_00707 [Clostridium sp. KLE 1755]|nr:hypothetical protein HMPREF1548_00707 [Clostridium sp. KLE 1755]
MWRILWDDLQTAASLAISRISYRISEYKSKGKLFSLRFSKINACRPQALFMGRGGRTRSAKLMSRSQYFRI